MTDDDTATVTVDNVAPSITVSCERTDDGEHDRDGDRHVQRPWLAGPPVRDDLVG